MNQQEGIQPLRNLFRALTLLVLLLYVGAAVRIWLDTLATTRATLTHIDSMLVQSARATLNSHELILRPAG